MHCLPLGLSKPLKERIAIMLKDKNRETIAVLYANKKPIPFNIVKHRVLMELNYFIWNFNIDSNGYELKFDSSKGQARETSRL